MTTYINPYSTSKRWLRGNLHAHTCCGRFMDISESGPMYASLGYDFLAVTDHNMAPDVDQWQTWQDQAKLLLIPGEENGQTDHILEIGVHTVTPTTDNDYANRAQALQQAGGFVIGCHPQEYAHGAQNIHQGLANLHAFEIFNGLRESRGCDEPANEQLWDEILTAGGRIWGVATDDFHCQYTTPGHGWVCVQVPETTEEVTWPMIVAQLKAGAFYASTYPAFEYIHLENDQLSAASDRHTKSMRVIGPGGQILYEARGTKLTWPVEADLAYFRLEAISGVKRAWSQPFFAAA
ncbi:MAG: hypothetical protein AAF629_25215 [Chloroflexota bacterium]